MLGRLAHRAACVAGCVLFVTSGWLAATPISAKPLPAAAAPGDLCYGQSHSLYFCPDQLRAAYGIDPLYQRGINGWGRTIVIVAVGSPGGGGRQQIQSLQTTVSRYDQMFGLPDTVIHLAAPFGGHVPGGPLSAELALDVETAHMVAPGAVIVIALDPLTESQPGRSPTAETSANLTQLYRVVRYAVRHNLGDVISLTYGFPETCVSPSALAGMHKVNDLARTQRITVVAATEDMGADYWTCRASGGYAFRRSVFLPAADPLVTAVGGTTLSMTVQGRYVSESAWGSGTAGAPWVGAGGGGTSVRYPQPAYQRGIRGLHGRRGIPDVSFVAGSPGVPVLFTDHGRLIQDTVAGTSVGAPAWAGLVALADQVAGRRLGFINPALYRIAWSPSYRSSFHDVTQGENDSVRLLPRDRQLRLAGYTAIPGWDAATGLGTPNAAHLVPLLARAQ